MFHLEIYNYTHKINIYIYIYMYLDYSEFDMQTLLEIN